MKPFPDTSVVVHAAEPGDGLRKLQAAMDAGCDAFFSEDQQAGRRFGALENVNPFDPAAHEPVPAARVLRKRKAPTRR